jgi:hypothetical protein
MGAPLVIRHGMNLIHNYSSRFAQHFPRSLRRKQNVERLRSRHQNVRRLFAHLLPFGSRRVTRPHRGRDRGEGHTPAQCKFRNLRQRKLEILLHIVRKSLQRGNVDYMRFVREFAGSRRTH